MDKEKYLKFRTPTPELPPDHPDYVPSHLVQANTWLERHPSIAVEPNITGSDRLAYENHPGIRAAVRATVEVQQGQDGHLIPDTAVWTAGREMPLGQVIAVIRQKLTELEAAKQQ